MLGDSSSRRIGHERGLVSTCHLVRVLSPCYSFGGNREKDGDNG